MSTTFALMDGGRVVEIIPSVVTVDDREVSLEDRYHSDFIAQLVPYDPENPPAEPHPPAPALPEVVSMRQARLALLATGKLQDVAPAIATLPSPQRAAAEIEWEYAAEVHRGSPIVAMLGAVLGLDDDALDALFTAAATL